MKKVLIIILLVCLKSVSANAQSNIRLSNYWNNTFYINPSSIDEPYSADFSMAARKQWVMFPGSPSTLFASAAFYNHDKRTQYGIKIFQDQLGYTYNTDIDLTYAYSIKVQDFWNLNLGLAASYQRLGYDESKMSFSSPDDDKILDRMVNEGNFNAEVGAELISKEWRIGLSSQNLLSLFYDINKQHANTNYLYAMYRKNSRNLVNLGYGVCGIQTANAYQMEFNVSTYFNVTPTANAFMVGLTYRTWSELGFMFGIDLSKNLKLSYSYDYNVSGISRSSLGTHEIMLTYKLDRVFRCRNCWY